MAIKLVSFDGQKRPLLRIPQHKKNIRVGLGGGVRGGKGGGGLGRGISSAVNSIASGIGQAMEGVKEQALLDWADGIIGGFDGGDSGGFDAGGGDFAVPENMSGWFDEAYSANPDLPEGYLETVASLESSFDPAASNGKHVGLYQFSPETGAEFGLYDADTGSDYRTDPHRSIMAAASLAMRNRDVLTEFLGRPPTAGELYMAHQQGATGAGRLLSDPEALATAVVGKGAVMQNRGAPAMTARDFSGMWLNKYDARRQAMLQPGGTGGYPQTTNLGAGRGLIYANQGKIRNQPVTPQVAGNIMEAARMTEPGLTVRVVSGGQPGKGSGGRRTGSTRHDHGNAADIVLMRDGREILPNQDRRLYASFLKNASSLGFTGLGHYPWGIHVGYGKRAAWGPDKTSRSLDPFSEAPSKRDGSTRLPGITAAEMTGAASPFLRTMRFVSDMILRRRRSIRNSLTGGESSLISAPHPTTITGRGGRMVSPGWKETPRTVSSMGRAVTEGADGLNHQSTQLGGSSFTLRNMAYRLRRTWMKGVPV